jgi:peptide/nickel transport system permease protein
MRKAGRGRRAVSALAGAWSRLWRRLVWALVVVVGVGSVSFILARALPGDPVRMVVGPQATPRDVEDARRIYALDRPVWAQYVRFWVRLLHRDDPASPQEHATCAAPVAGLHVDLGFSYRFRKPVVALIAERAPRSFQLAVAALLLQTLLGLGLGLWSAHTRGTVWDQLAIGASLVGVSAPIFALGLGLQYLLAHRLGWLPSDGYGETSGEQLRSLILPALTLGIYGAALYARLSRDEVSRALSQDHVRTARAKGAGEVRVLLVHALRTAMVPIATLAVLDLGALIGGAIVTEKLFRWPGMGSMAVDAMVNRDGPVIFGTVLFSSLAIVVASLLVDVVTVLLDPRLRRPAALSRG